MPDEYISREAALKDFEASNAENPRWTPQRVKTLLLRQPAADVAEVVHGQWLLDSRWPSWQHRECSRCKITFQRTTEVEDQYWQYCPNCGARMDGGNGECRGVTE